MTETEQAILQTLIDLEVAIKNMAAANPKPDLKPFFNQVDELTRQLPRDADPELLHFLHRKSYQKARAYLEGRQAESGSCRH